MTAAKPKATFDQNRLLDETKRLLGCRSDADLCRALGMSPPQISKLRHETLNVGPSVLVRIHEQTGLSIAGVRALMGDHRPKYHE